MNQCVPIISQKAAVKTRNTGTSRITKIIHPCDSVKGTTIKKLSYNTNKILSSFLTLNKMQCTSDSQQDSCRNNVDVTTVV